jgi:L-seryl-tRNA(Ser) seleniumtransferase
VDNDVLRELPAVGTILGHAMLAESLTARGRAAVARAVRAAIQEARSGLLAGRALPIDEESLAHRSCELLEFDRPALRPVINATGILLHTGLGRAPLAEEAIAAVAATARGYCNLELDLAEGTRGKRTTGVAALLKELTGAPAATVVNNNAGATILALKGLAAGREVIVSRGQLVEIGGSFRLPEICEVSGARLREVGTTNKTRLADYQRAIGPETAAILRVHRSNFEIVGFTEDVPLDELVSLAHGHGLFAIDDIGSGALDATRPPGIGGEPTVAAGIAAGADLVLFSGDKLLGGPQCGIMLGTEAAIERVDADPLKRALRLDKMTLAALEATLRLIVDPDQARKRIPLWSMIDLPLTRLAARAAKMARLLRDELGLKASVIEAQSYIGGGSAPLHPLETMLIAVSAPFPTRDGSEASWAQALRQGEPPIITRVQKGQVLFDLRTVAEELDPSLIEAIRKSQQPARPSKEMQDACLQVRL